MTNKGFLSNDQLKTNKLEVETEAFAIQRAQMNLEHARHAIDVVRVEYAAQLLLLENELKVAQLAVAAALKDYERVSDANRRIPRSISAAEMDRHGLNLERAKLSVHQARTALELYRKAGEGLHGANEQRETSDAADDDSGSDEPQTNSETGADTDELSTGKE